MVSLLIFWLPWEFVSSFGLRWRHWGSKLQFVSPRLLPGLRSRIALVCPSLTRSVYTFLPDLRTEEKNCATGAVSIVQVHDFEIRTKGFTRASGGDQITHFPKRLSRFGFHNKIYDEIGYIKYRFLSHPSVYKSVYRLHEKFWDKLLFIWKLITICCCIILNISWCSQQIGVDTNKGLLKYFSTLEFWTINIDLAIAHFVAFV